MKHQIIEYVETVGLMIGVLAVMTFIVFLGKFALLAVEAYYDLKNENKGDE